MTPTTRSESMTQQLKNSYVPVAHWTPHGLIGPMVFDLSTDDGVRGLAGEIQMAFEGFEDMVERGDTVMGEFGKLTVSAMPRHLVEALPEHPGW